MELFDTHFVWFGQVLNGHITASWCHSSGFCWVVLLDGHTWQMVSCPARVRYLVSWQEDLSAHCQQCN